MDSWSASSTCLVKTLINYSILQLHQGWSWPFHQCRRNSRWSFPTNPAACTTCKAGCRSSDQRSSATELKLPIRILLVQHSMETGGNICSNFGVILRNYWVYNPIYRATEQSLAVSTNLYNLIYIYIDSIILISCMYMICTYAQLPFYLFSFLAARLWIGAHGGHVQRLWRLTSESAAEKLGPTAFCSSFQWNCHPCLYNLYIYI